MEQLNNNPALAMLQGITSQNQLPKTGKSDGDSDFQKLMEKAASGQPDSRVEERPKAGTETAAKKDKAPVQKREEDPVEASKKAQIVVVGQLDPETLPDPVILENPVTGGELTIIQGDWAPQVWAYESTPEEIAGDPSPVGERMQPIDVSAPKADAVLEAIAPDADTVLEAIAPDADNAPAAMLERLTAEQFGTEVRQMTDRAPETVKNAIQPEEQLQEGDDSDAVPVDVEQAPQRLFHDVKAAPVKVGEVYEAPRTERPDVAKQIDTGLAEALQKGESLVRIQLNPEHLGSVTVELARSAEGVIRVALSAHSVETRSLLERHAGELQGLIASRTQQSVEVDVQRQSESQQGQNQQHQQNQQNYDGHNGHSQDGQERRRQNRERGHSQDFIQQLRLGLIPADE